MHSRRTLLSTASAVGVSAAIGSLPALASSETPLLDGELVAPDSQGMAAAALDNVLEDGAALPGLRCLLIARRGHLVAERYYGGAKDSDLLPLNSITKSVGSMLVGQALRDGKIGSLSQTVGQLLPESATMRPDAPAWNIALGEILTGTTGLAFSMSQLRDLVRAPDPVAYVMGLPGDGRPKGSWAYNDAAVSLLTPILEHAHGMSVADVAKRDLFVPLGIDRFAGKPDASGHVMAYTGLRLRARDALKLALVMCHGGAWNQVRVLSQQWVADSLDSHAVPNWRFNQVSNPGYGYQWFNGTMAGQRVAWAWGYGGQVAMVVPALEMVIVTTATSPPLAELSAQVNAVMGLIARIVSAAA